MQEYTINCKQVGTVYLVEVYRSSVVQRRASGGNRESALSQLKIKLRCEAETGQRAQEILEFLETEENSNVAG